MTVIDHGLRATGYGLRQDGHALLESPQSNIDTRAWITGTGTV